MASNDNLRSVKIGADERTGWSSDRPRGERTTSGRGGRPPKPQGRAKTVAASDVLSFPSGSLVLFTGADATTVHRLVGRLLPRPAVIAYDPVARAVTEKVGAEQAPALTLQLVGKAVKERLGAGQSVVLETSDLSTEVRTGLAALAAPPAGSHLVVLESGRKAVGDDERFEVLRTLANDARSGEIGSEGFSTAVVLGRSDLDKVTEVEFTQRKERR
jgi:hypothetical protein